MGSYVRVRVLMEYFSPFLEPGLPPGCVFGVGGDTLLCAAVGAGSIWYITPRLSRLRSLILSVTVNGRDQTAKVTFLWYLSWTLKTSSQSLKMSRTEMSVALSEQNGPVPLNLPASARLEWGRGCLLWNWTLKWHHAQPIRSLAELSLPLLLVGWVYSSCWGRRPLLMLMLLWWMAAWHQVQCVHSLSLHGFSLTLIHSLVKVTLSLKTHAKMRNGNGVASDSSDGATFLTVTEVV